MTRKIPTKKELEKCLEDYTNIISSDPDNTRLSTWPLYDFYLKILRLAALKFNIDDTIFAKYSSNVSSRWNIIKDYIDEISPEDANLEKYNKIIIMIQNFSSKVRHKDDFVPPRNRLDEIYKEAMKFHKWLSLKGEKFATSNKKDGIMEKIEKREQFGGGEWVIKSEGICPKCGKNPSMIIRYLGEKDKPPNAAVIRIECEDCCYLIDTEVITVSEHFGDPR
jgi:hypothetical protein